MAIRQRPRQLFPVGFQVLLELLHRHMIYARRSVVSLHAFKGSPQIAQRVDLVHQAEPLPSQHSLFECRQHPFRPDRGFDPGPTRPNLSGGTSPVCGHCVRELLRLFRHVSTFLRSLRSLAVTPVRRYYGRSDSCPPGSSALLGHELRLLHGQVSLIHAPGLPTILSPTTGRRSVSPRHVTFRRIESRSLPYGFFSLRELEASAFTRRLAPPRRPNRVSCVRTGRSPPVALHPVSRRRGYLRLPSYVDSKRTSTPSTKCAFRRTSAAACCRFFVSQRAGGGSTLISRAEVEMVSRWKSHEQARGRGKAGTSCRTLSFARSTRLRNQSRGSVVGRPHAEVACGALR